MLSRLSGVVKRPPVRRVALLIDRQQIVDGDPDLTSRAALKHAPMEYHIGASLRRSGFDVTLIPCLSGAQLVRDLAAAAPEVVFNATEHMYGRRASDLQIAALLELLRLPYTGADPSALLISRDKAISKSLAEKVGVRIPPYALAPRGFAVRDVPPFPVVVKPVGGDSSEGITMASVVRSEAALKRQLAVVHRRGTAIIEAFIPGEDVYVFAWRDERLLHVLPPWCLRIGKDPSSPRSMATYQVKHNDAYRARWRIRSHPAKFDAARLRELRAMFVRLWPALQLRDYARIDCRLTPSGELYFIESNANPGFSPVSRCDDWELPEYDKAIRAIVLNAARRGVK
jgi:D-alanine-D-alanine ligase